MKTINQIICIALILACNPMLFAQKTIKEYVTKNNTEKIKKSIIIDALSKPATHKSFKDGHGKTPYLSSIKQLPDTLALITFHIIDVEGVSKFSWWDETGQLSAQQGNLIANKINKQTIVSLKEAFKERGAVLLTPEEFLDTEKKRNFYYNSFAPEVSKVGTFLNNIENINTDISVCANNYRYFDMGAAADYKRSESLGNDLAKELGVDGLLSVSVGFYSDSKGAYTNMIKMAIHGPNPNPKVDKKYVGQKNGTGYYEGQLYFAGKFTFKKPIKTIEVDYKKKKTDNINFEGTEVIFSSFIEKYYDEMNKAIDKVSK